MVFRSVGTPLAGWYWGSETEGTLWMQGPSPLLLLPPLRAAAEACALGEKYAMGKLCCVDSHGSHGLCIAST